MKTVTIKVKDDVFQLAEEMVKLGIARSRNEAFNILISYGIDKAREEVRKKKRVNELVEKWLKEGVPFELPTSEDVLRERE
ncbi:MAG: VapB-type antitoxin [Thermoprotei archaeon]